MSSALLSPLLSVQLRKSHVADPTRLDAIDACKAVPIETPLLHIAIRKRDFIPPSAQTHASLVLQRDLPPGPPWPLRKVYYVDLRDDEELALARRLHNLGFSGKPSLEENICEFERSYGYPMTGDSDRVRAALIAHHDGASDPGELDTESAGALAFDEPEIPLGDVDPPEKSQDRNTGCASSVPVMPSPFKIRDSLIYEWTPITTTHKGLEATFWVFRDAAKWDVPIGYFPEWYRPPTIGDPIHGGFLCRLPGTVQQHEAVAKRIYSTPRSLTGDDEQPLMASSAALLMTSYLYDERYRQADCKVPPPRGLNTSGCMFLMTPRASWLRPGLDANDDRRRLAAAGAVVVLDPRPSAPATRVQSASAKGRR